MKKANVGVNFYYPEMGDRKPIAEIEAKLSYGGKWRLKTPLELKGRGIKHQETLDESNCNNPAKFGWHIYHATELAFQKLTSEYAISSENLLD